MCVRRYRLHCDRCFPLRAKRRMEGIEKKAVNGGIELVYG